MKTETVLSLDFRVIQLAIAKQFKVMSERPLFTMKVDKDKLWETYLQSFPEGTNPIHKERTQHDCSCCRHFIKTLGGVVNIVDGKIVTLWDVNITGDSLAYQQVADAMASYVRAQAVENLFLHPESWVGQANSRQLLADKSVQTWDHFHVNLPTSAVMRGDKIGTTLGGATATHDVMLRGLSELTLDAVDTVLELIAQNSLYRGEEHKFALAEFRKLLAKFVTLSRQSQELFIWEHLNVPQPVSRIRNTAIGTLLIDLSADMGIEEAVRKFETSVMAPANYKRPTALVSKAMIAKAQEAVQELGLTSALDRRYAVIEDITVNNVLFADRSARREMSVFDNLASSVAVDVKSLGKVEEISIDNFLSKVVPTATTIELLVENRHAGNFVSLVAPVDPTAKPLFKWPNLFSWSYAGDMADSIKQRVKAAGGDVAGDFRASLAWHNFDDLDLHLKQPNGREIWWRERQDLLTGAWLDVDMNASRGTTRTPVENIAIPEKRKMPEGVYSLAVHQWEQRESLDVGFEVEIEFGGEVYTFAYTSAVRHQHAVEVCRFSYTHKDGLKILESLPVKHASKTIWGIQTQNFHKVRVVMLSPNHWDERAVGNKHFMFMLEGCVNEGKARGFFNEFLNEELSAHRKVLEMVGAKMRTEESDRQLSGLGFSSTQRNHLMCRVTGAFTRVVKVMI